MKIRWLGALGIVLSSLLLSPFTAWSDAGVIKIGFDLSLTGDKPKVGEVSKNAALLFRDQINKAGGIKVGDKTYTLEFIYEDSESKAESATAAAMKLITENGVLAVIGPQASVEAVPAGEVCNSYKTPMISPWSTNPATTKDRPYVFRVAFLDPFQGAIIARFVVDELKAEKAAVLYDISSDAPKGQPSISSRPSSRPRAPARWSPSKPLPRRIRTLAPNSPRSSNRAPTFYSFPSITAKSR
jgi:branched-chain amino acid transport system substrate-binding protein